MGLIELIKQQCISYGDFTLASGRKSKYYIDLRPLLHSTQGLMRATNLLSSALVDDESKPVDSIGVLGYGADVLIGALLKHAFMWGHDDLRGFVLRKEEKDYGKGGRVIGDLRKGDRVTILDDVATSGGSLIKVARYVREFGAIPIQAWVILDRVEGAVDALAKEGVPLHSAIKIHDLGLK